MSMVIRVVSVGGCSRQYESCLQHKCHLVLGVSPITMMKCCRPRGYPGAGHHGGSVTAVLENNRTHRNFSRAK